MKKQHVSKLAINKLTVANLGETYGGDLPDRTWQLTCLSCKGTCKCQTPATQATYCLCTTVDLNCPTGQLPC